MATVGVKGLTGYCAISSHAAVLRIRSFKARTL